MTFLFERVDLFQKLMIRFVDVVHDEDVVEIVTELRFDLFRFFDDRLDVFVRTVIVLEIIMGGY